MITYKSLTIKNKLIKLKIIHSIFCQFGINLLKLKNIIYIPWFIKCFLKYKNFANGNQINSIFPVFGEHKEKSSAIIKHYFNQDLLVASYIYKNNPKKHVDVGSRVDGFVAHVATFRKIEVFDIRDNNFQFKNIIFKRKDISKIDKSLTNYCDSLSCLHTLEHFGLGRYGDQLDPNGHIKGFWNLIKILKTDGMLYISFPISDKNVTYFNSERSFNPKEILKWSNDLRLVKFDFIDDYEKIFLDVDLNKFRKKISYGCGIYTFKKR
jgi:hypothetical protein